MKPSLIFGELVSNITQHLEIYLVNWRDIERRAGSLALRSMSDPKSEGQPDTYGGTNWKTIDVSTQTNDYCRVHTNSGVLNHWFYILTIGSQEQMTLETLIMLQE
jgi:Zn-dependent metalloprotease